MAGHLQAIAVRRLVLLTILLILNKKRQKEEEKKRLTRRLYQHPVTANRPAQSDYHHLIQEVWASNEGDRRLLRMNKAQFDDLLQKVGPSLTKKKRHRFPISPAERLSLTLRYLASGDAQTSIADDFRVGKSTLHQILKETCKVLWDTLKDDVLKFPTSEQKWQEIADGFKTRWNFPNCVGAIDGKHVNMQAPPMSGSRWFNYKYSHSMILMAACDSNYCFTFVDIGAPGRQSDGRVFAASALGQLINTNRLALPDAAPLEEGGLPYPFVFVADEAFPLKSNIMRPFPGRVLPERQKIFNYRLSRARRVIENCFGILCQKWQLFRAPITGFPENIELYLKAAIVLHNWLRKTEAKLQPNRRIYCPPRYADWIDKSGRIRDGLWRGEAKKHPPSNLQTASRLGSNNHTFDAAQVRSGYMHYFSTSGSVPWQLHHVRHEMAT